jgi:hypothetical protein
MRRGLSPGALRGLPAQRSGISGGRVRRRILSRRGISWRSLSGWRISWRRISWRRLSWRRLSPWRLSGQSLSWRRVPPGRWVSSLNAFPKAVGTPLGAVFSLGTPWGRNNRRSANTGGSRDQTGGPVGPNASLEMSESYVEADFWQQAPPSKRRRRPIPIAPKNRPILQG